MHYACLGHACNISLTNFTSVKLKDQCVSTTPTFADPKAIWQKKQVLPQVSDHHIISRVQTGCADVSRGSVFHSFHCSVKELVFVYGNICLFLQTNENV